MAKKKISKGMGNNGLKDSSKPTSKNQPKPQVVKAKK